MIKGQYDLFEHVKTIEELKKEIVHLNGILKAKGEIIKALRKQGRTPR